MNDTKENRKYKQPSKLSSSAATFLSLCNGKAETLTEYRLNPNPKPKPKPKTELEILNFRSKYLALELLALWTPNSFLNKHNYMCRHVHLSSDFSVFSVCLSAEAEEETVSYSSVDLDSIISNYEKTRVFNIGALMLFNIIFAGKFTVENLKATKSTKDETYYFVQNQYEKFFIDFLYGDRTDYITEFSGFGKGDTSDSWWSIFTGHENAVLHEIFITAFRIQSTPDSLIELIIDSTLGKMYRFQEFKSYIMDRKKNALSILFRNLTQTYAHEIDNLKRTRGAKIMIDFAEDIENFLSIYSMNSYGNYLQENLAHHANILSDYLKFIKLETFYLASFINLPWPLPELNPEHVEVIALTELSSIFNSLIKVIDKNWNILAAFPDFYIWKYTNSLAKYLYDLSDYRVIKTIHITFLIPLFIFAAKNDFNDFCKFLLKENCHIAHAVINQNKYTNYVFVGLTGKSVDECLEEFHNTELLSLVNAILSGGKSLRSSRFKVTKINELEPPKEDFTFADSFEPKGHKKNYGRRKSLHEDDVKSINPSMRRNASNLEQLSLLRVEKESPRAYQQAGDASKDFYIDSSI